MHHLIALDLYKAHVAEWERNAALRQGMRHERRRWRFPRLSRVTRHRRRAQVVARAGTHACR